MYKCNQQGCIRDFDGSEKFRQHLKLIPDVIHQFSFNNTCQTSDITPVLNLPEEVVNTNDSSIYIEDNIGPNETNYFYKSFEDIVRNCVLQFITKLYTNPNVTEFLMQEIVDGATELFSSGIISNLKTKIMPHLFNSNKTEIAEIEKMLTVLENPF